MKKTIRELLRSYLGLRKKIKAQEKKVALLEAEGSISRSAEERAYLKSLSRGRAEAQETYEKALAAHEQKKG